MATDSVVADTQPPGTALNMESNTNGSAVVPDPDNKPQQKKLPRKKKKNYAQIHSKPLPVDVFPLPAFNPTHPASLLRLCYVWLSQLLYPPSSHPTSNYIGVFSAETRSVHVTDPIHVRALWEMGFFGKGTLSRSEPSWLERAKAKVKAERSGGTAEEATNARREERRRFKLERARLEREKIERQRAVEEGRMTVEEAAKLEAGGGELPGPDDAGVEQIDTAPLLPTTDLGRVPDQELLMPQTIQAESDLPLLNDADELAAADPDIENQEHLQLTLEESFFLAYGLGVLDIVGTDIAISPTNLLQIFGQHSTFPPSQMAGTISPDNPFILNYVAYHHFRSLGWVVRPGVKFACDYLLYNRGPVFSHAEFGVIILPAYTHPYWSTEQGLRERRITGQKDWWWLHCVNRVQSQVKKTLVMVYVDVPPPMEEDREDVGVLLRGYKVREFVVRRWLANRSRD